MKKVRLLQAAVAIAVVAVVVVRLHPGDVWRTLRDVDLSDVALALALNIPVLGLTPVRSAMVYRRLGLAVPVRVLVPTTVLGFVAGGLTPAAAGELLRAYGLRSRAGVALEHGVAAVVYERGLSLYYLALSTIAIAVLGLPAGPAVAAMVAIAVLAAMPWLGATVLWRFLPEAEALRGEGLVRRMLRNGLSTLEQVRILLRDPALLVGWASVSIVMFALIATQYWLLARSVGGGIGLGDAWIAFGVSTFAGVAALIPLGLGVLDGSLAATLDRLGATLEQGGAVAVLVRGAVTLPLLLAALASYVYLQRVESVDAEAAVRSGALPPAATE